MSDTPPMSADVDADADSIREQIKQHEWIHTIDLGHGVVTPGRWPAENGAHIRAVIDQLDFSGKKVLDVGCLDGLYSFDAEKKGASEIYSTDLITQVFPPRDS